MAIERMSISKEIKDSITSSIPDYLIKERSGGGGKMLSYLSGSTITDMLNKTFGYMWSWDVKNQWIEKSIPYFNSYAKVPESQKVEYNGKKGAWEDQGPIAHVLGVITVYLRDEISGNLIEITKEGYGSKSVLGKQNDQESIFKAAGTDALKKAASLFGIGLQLYRDEEEQAYFNTINYEDPWTDESRATHADALAFLSEYTSTYQVSDEDLANLVFSYTGETSYDITPDIIEDFVTYIKSAIENQ